MKPGWVSHPGLENVLIGHKPKVLRTPTPKHPSRIIRTTWVFRDGEWSRIEDKVTLEVYTVMSITIFERSFQHLDALLVVLLRPLGRHFSENPK